MKKIFLGKLARYTTIFLLLFAFSVTFTSCVVRSSHHNKHRSLPPGQHKKIHGERSAKRYAPGQQKKHSKKNNGKKHSKHNR